MRLVLVYLVLPALFTSCSTSTGTGALVGGAAGATAGGLIAGSATGALIGGAVGAVGGGLIGASMDAQERDNMQRTSPRTMRKIDLGEPLTIKDVKNMSKAGLSDDLIISQIEATQSEFRLSASDIIDLKQAGVSQRVIEAMIETTNH
jgi:outer membrane lipoprotein SlyB